MSRRSRSNNPHEDSPTASASPRLSSLKGRVAVGSSFPHSFTCFAQTGLTCCPIAHTKPASSRAIATTILLRLPPRDQPAYLGHVLISPRRLHQGASGRAVARFGDRALPATFAG